MCYSYNSIKELLFFQKTHAIFGIFKKKTQKQLLQEKYRKLMEHVHRLSKSKR
ncbi:MAG: Lacal_2735 family protein [Eudoraea sp.]|uniref:Lacal_2735 family protein n=1 Tax=Eudoraea sp. TaxID=1979955 RepID=UPI003C73276C